MSRWSRDILSSGLLVFWPPLYSVNRNVSESSLLWRSSKKNVPVYICLTPFVPLVARFAPEWTLCNTRLKKMFKKLKKISSQITFICFLLVSMYVHIYVCMYVSIFEPFVSFRTKINTTNYLITPISVPCTSHKPCYQSKCLVITTLQIVLQFLRYSFKEVRGPLKRRVDK